MTGTCAVGAGRLLMAVALVRAAACAGSMVVSVDGSACVAVCEF